MVALLWGHDQAGIESTVALVGILALPLPPMGWIHAIGKFAVVHQFAYDIVHSTGVLWFFISPFDSHLYLGHLQDLTKLELAEMPSCNLAEAMHHKWNQQSGNRGSDLYIATIDDFIRALMQVVRSYQYLKGD
jgi:hypothetical protein